MRAIAATATCLAVALALTACSSTAPSLGEARASATAAADAASAAALALDPAAQRRDDWESLDWRAGTCWYAPPITDPVIEIDDWSRWSAVYDDALAPHGFGPLGEPAREAGVLVARASGAHGEVFELTERGDVRLVAPVDLAQDACVDDALTG